MARDRFPPDALDRAGFYSLYSGGLDFDAPEERLRACYVILGMGRLGLRLEELQHLHEGWIDWERGEIRVPAHEPCGCQACWQAAAATNRDDDRQVEEILHEEQWSPPDDRGARTIPFGYSKRLTAALARFLDRWEYLDATQSEVQTVLHEAGANAPGIDEERITTGVLRRTAGHFLARVGLDVRHVSRVLGTDEDEAEEYVRRVGRRTTRQLYEALSDPMDVGDVPSAVPDEPTETFPIVCEPSEFDREPFNVGSYDEDRRVQRAGFDDSDPPVGNPRSPTSFEGLEYDPERVDPVAIRDRDSQWYRSRIGSTAPVSTLEEWVADREADRLGLERKTGTAEDQGSSVTQLGDGPLHDALEGHVIEDLSMQFASTDIQPDGLIEGRAMLGPKRLVMSGGDRVARRAWDGEGDQAIAVELDTVIDVSTDRVPDRLADDLDSPVTIAYKNGNRGIVVIDPYGTPGDELCDAIFETILDGIEVWTTHPARIGGRVMDNEPTRAKLSITDYAIEFESRDGTFEIRPTAITHIEKNKQEINEEVTRMLSIRHQVNDSAVTTKVGADSNRLVKLLFRYLDREYGEKRRASNQLSLSDPEKEVLVALYSSGGGADLEAILQSEIDDLGTVLSSLNEKGLVTRNNNGVTLTETGSTVVSDKLDEVNA